MTKTNSLSKQVFNGARWYVAMRWSVKGMGFISSAFLARLLVPEDFGLVATVLVIFGLISLLFEFGVNWALIQNNNATDDDFDTAWTIRIIQALVVSVILMIVAPYIAQWYEDARIEFIVYIVATATLIKGFENIGIVKFQKEMQFSKDFSFKVFPKILSTAVTISLAFYYQSYMALVVGTLIASSIEVIISYVMCHYRPRFTLNKFSDIWGFSQWVLVRNFADYISQQGDILLLSGMTTTTNLGFYRWATELSFMAVTEVQQPFSRVLVPALVKLKTEPTRLIAAYLKALSAMTLVAIPVALGFGAVSQELIPIFLGGGDKWLPIVPIINGLVFFAMATAMYGTSINLLTITGNVKYIAYISWFTAAITVASLYPAYQYLGLIGIAYSRIFIGILTFIIVSVLVSNRCGVAIMDIIAAIWRPVFSGIVMYFTLLQLSDMLTVAPWLILVIKIMVGAVIYTSLTLALWYLAGKPATMEADIINKIKTKLIK